MDDKVVVKQPKSQLGRCLHTTHLDTCPGLCSGDAWWLYNLLCCPIVLVYRSFMAYIVATLFVFARRLGCFIFCGLCRASCPSLFHFTDKKFPHGPGAIIHPAEAPDKDNEFYGMTPDMIARKIDWKRADEILRATIHKRQASRHGASKEKMSKSPRMFLYAGGIAPEDVVQGQLGDCWLLAALASMAEYPDAIRNCIVETEATTRGIYHVRLWDCGAKRWRKISVDDYIPVEAGTTTPYFSNPSGFELWVFIIEKAIAKFVGGYAYLDGGQSPWAWHTLTGDNVFSFKKLDTGDVWARYIYEFEGSEERKRQRHRTFLRDTHDRCNTVRLFELLRMFCRHRAVMGAAFHKQASANMGLIASHAYSVIDVVRAHGFSLVKLRNPWGHGEWAGDWSDKSPLWERYPDVKRHCELHEDDFDGAFWMSFDDFVSHFERIDVCDRSAHRDLRLDVREDEGLWGVCKGCSWGCFKFWCMCKGLRLIYFGHRTSTDVEYRAPMCSCREDHGRGWVDNSVV